MAEYIDVLAEIDALPEQTTDCVKDAIAKLADDPGSIFKPEVIATLRETKAKKPDEFARIRADVKQTKIVPMGEFDRLTAQQSKSENASDPSAMFKEIEAWQQPINGAKLLDDIVSTFSRFVTADKETLEAGALWTAMTYFMEVVEVSPIANISAPLKRCGKTILLTCIAKASYNALMASDISTTALFRSMEKWQLTMVIDEVDAFMRDNEEARGIINSGLYRDGAYVVRCVGEDHTPTQFCTWGPKVLCGIGKIADTLADRSIPLRLRRKKPGESVERIRHSGNEVWETLRSKLLRFAMDNKLKVRDTRPSDIEGLHDRANDCWEPLQQIAIAAGENWPDRARKAALALHGIEEDSPSIDVELLGDIKAAFHKRRVDRLFSRDLLQELIEEEEASWATWNRGRPMTARQLSKRLDEFGIRSNSVRNGLETAKGYKLEQFTDVFDRYLSGDTPDSSVTTSHTSIHAGSSGFKSVTQQSYVTDKKGLKASNHAGCDVVTDKTEESVPWEIEI